MKTRPLAMTGVVACCLCAALTVTALTGTARAAFLPIDDFDDLQPGPINGQNGWYALSANSAVVQDPVDGSNQVLRIVTESTRLHREVILLDGTQRTLFLRFRYEDQLNFSLGMSEAAVPDQFGDFDVELNMSNASNDLRVNDDGSYLNLTVLEPETWYNVWLEIDNEENLTAIWLHGRDGEPALASDRLVVDDQSAYEFRDRLVGDMLTFFIKTGGGSGVLGPLHIDDIYLENTSSTNLSNPANSPTDVTPTSSLLPSLTVYPNPFNPRTTISFDLPFAQKVEVTIHDLAGRMIVSLIAGELAAGKHALIWKGRNRRGHEVPTGLYLVRLRSAVGEQTRKIQLVR